MSKDCSRQCVGKESGKVATSVFAASARDREEGLSEAFSRDQGVQSGFRALLWGQSLGSDGQILGPGGQILSSGQILGPEGQRFWALRARFWALRASDFGL